jgi:hypothetical protein
MEIWIALISGLCVAVPNVIATLVTNNNNKIDEKLTKISVSFEKSLKDLKIAINGESLDRAKNDLIVIMSRIKNGYTPTSEEVMVLYETKEKYNKLGGDSYVDDMFEKLKKEGKL